MPYSFTYTWNLRDKQAKEKERERETKKQILNYREHTDGHQRGGGGGWGKQVMGMKVRTCRDEHQVMDGSDESLYCTPETNITLCVNYS